MQKRFLVVSLLAALAAALPALAANPGKQPTQQPSSESQVSADNLPAGKFTGTIVSPPDSNRMMTLKIDYQNVQVNQQALASLNSTLQRDYQNILRLQQQLQREMMQQGNPRSRPNVGGTVSQLQQAIARLQQAQARAGQSIYKVTPASATVSFQLEQEVKVRTAMLPEAFDDKGNIKKYTPAELKELKGPDHNLPGYQSSLDQLQPGTVVQVILAHHQQPAKKAVVAAEKMNPDAAAIDAVAEPAAATEHKMQVKMIMIVGDGLGTGLSGKKR